MVKTILSTEWVASHMEHSDVVLADCRFVLGQPQAGKESYAKDHLPGAVHFDLEQDLSGSKMPHGGRHPLPEPAALAEKLGQAGIDASKKVVAYDDQGGAMASRFWWLLKWLGHEEVYVMDGGYSKWKEDGFPVTHELPDVKPAVFKSQPHPELLASMKEVRSKLNRPGVTLIDSRESKRYLGVEETIVKAAGHIPGARNEFWKESLTADGYWKPAEDQRHRFAHLSPDDEIIVYCGSGVTATPNFMALTEAGFPNVKLYAGSWSDWVSYEDNPIATGEE